MFINFLKYPRNLLFLKKKDMEIIVDKPNYVIIKTSYGHYIDSKGVTYPFSVDVSETNGEQKWIEISWDDNLPINNNEVEQELMEIFAGSDK